MRLGMCVLAFMLFDVGLCHASSPMKPEEIKVEGMRITLGTGQTITVEPLAPKHAETTGVLKVVKPDWFGGFRLANVGWIYRALKPGSLRVTVVDKPETVLAEGTDYSLDANWATVGAVEGSKVAVGTSLKFEYDFTLSRLDLVERLADGKVALKQGVEDRTVPRLPEATPGATPLFSVYLPPNTTTLSQENILIIDPAASAVAPVLNASVLKPVLVKLQAGEPVTIAFLGDSITAQKASDMKDGQGSYIDRFAKYLETRYEGSKVVVTPMETVVKPAAKQVVIVKAGIGGNDSGQGLKRIDKDVMAHKPDLVVIMFGVNDENKKGESNQVPPVEYRANFEQMIAKVKAAGGQMILMTTSMKNTGWSATRGNLNEYAAVIRDLAKAHNLCCVDNFAAWENLPKRGYHYMIYLGTCINHPVDLGHQLFFEGLKTAFESGK